MLLGIAKVDSSNGKKSGQLQLKTAKHAEAGTQADFKGFGWLYVGSHNL